MPENRKVNRISSSADVNPEKLTTIEGMSISLLIFETCSVPFICFTILFILVAVNEEHRNNQQHKRAVHTIVYGLGKRAYNW